MAFSSAVLTELPVLLLENFADIVNDYWSKLLGNSPAGLDTFKIDPETPDEEITPEYLLENFWIVGDPDYCISEIGKLHKESGGFGTLLIQTDDWGNNNSQFFNSMDLMAKEVMPAIKDL